MAAELLRAGARAAATVAQRAAGEEERALVAF